METKWEEKDCSHYVPVAELFGFLEDVCGQDDRASLPRLLADCIKRRPLVDRVHAGGRLVQEHERLVHHEDLRDLDSPLQTAAQVDHAPVAMLGQAELIHHGLRFRAELPARDGMEEGVGPEVVQDGEEHLDRALLEDHAQVLPDLEGFAYDVVAHDLGRPGGGRDQRREDPQERGLPGTVPPEDPEDLTPLDREGQS